MRDKQDSAVFLGDGLQNRAVALRFGARVLLGSEEEELEIDAVAFIEETASERDGVRHDGRQIGHENPFQHFVLVQSAVVDDSFVGGVVKDQAGEGNDHFRGHVGLGDDDTREVHDFLHRELEGGDVVAGLVVAVGYDRLRVLLEVRAQFREFCVDNGVMDTFE